MFFLPSTCVCAHVYAHTHIQTHIHEEGCYFTNPKKNACRMLVNLKPYGASFPEPENSNFLCQIPFCATIDLFCFVFNATIDLKAITRCKLWL